MNYANIEIQDGVAIVWLDQQDSKVNKISPNMIEEFVELFDRMENEDEIQAAVIISRKKDFIAGADLDAIHPITEPGKWEAVSRKGHALLNRMANSRKPVVAAIHGSAMGGGLEVALACHYRIATDDKRTVMALPEVKLGLLPGGGGTQRLPRLIGIQNALDMMLTGKNVYAGKAKKLGLVDRLVNKHALLRAAKAQALSMVGKEIERADKRPLSQKALESNPASRSIIFSQARKMVWKQTSGNYSAPFKIIECVEIGAKYGMEAGLEAEIKKFDELVVHPVSKQLINIFFAMTDKKKNPMADKVKKTDTLAMLGAGFMGAGITEVSITKGMDVLLKDIKEETIASAKQTIWKNLSKRVGKKAMSSLERDHTMNRIHSRLDYRGFEKVDMVIEAVFEDLNLKKRIIKEVEGVTRKDCIFASNTSALPISAIAEASSRPETVIGMHYFSPVPKMPLLEIIVTDKTADWVTATALEVGIRQGKTCIVVKDGPGFYTTRILAPLMNEALLILEEGASIEQIDRCAQELGFPVGPITLIDEVGIDVGAHIMEGDLAKFFKEHGGDAVRMSTLPMDLFKAGYHGRKNGKGFYKYETKKGKTKKDGVNESVYEFVGGKERREFRDKHIRHRLMMVITNEAARCYEMGVLQTPLDGDVGAIFGLGYPPFTGGPFRFLDSIGCKLAVERMEKLSELYGERFLPCDLIREYAASGKKFYS